MKTSRYLPNFKVLISSLHFVTAHTKRSCWFVSRVKEISATGGGLQKLAPHRSNAS